METIAINTLSRLGYWGVFLLITAENLFPPIPSEVILSFAGFMTTFTGMSVWGVALAATLGSVTGAIILYTLGSRLHAGTLGAWVEGRYGRMLHLKKTDLRRAERWFRRYGQRAVFFCRFVPLVRSLISLPAGMAKIPKTTFLLLTALGSLIWNLALVSLGTAAGSSWTNVVGFVDKYSALVLAALVVLAAALASILLRRRRRP